MFDDLSIRWLAGQAFGLIALALCVAGFASKRDDGIYARLYLTEIDDEGHASPAIRLPLLEEPLASFNIPEFVAQKPRIEEPELFDIVRVEALAREVAALDQRR